MRVTLGRGSPQAGARRGGGSWGSQTFVCVWKLDGELPPSPRAHIEAGAEKNKNNQNWRD